MIIYPAIDIKDGQCVRLEQGDFNKKTVFDGDPAAVAKRWQDAGAKWLHIIDLDGSKAGKPINNETIRKILNVINIPIQVGGGNRTMEDISIRLEMGVARVILGTVVLDEPAFAKEAAAKYGERIAVGVDALKGKVAISAWQSVTEVTTNEILSNLHEKGIKTVIYTDIAKDGMMSGPNFNIYNEAAAYGLDIIASGGVSSMEDLAKLSSMNVSGAIIGKALFVGAINLKEAIEAYDK
jgi:phosphoribosylformimino-5-aminoimidazole carboxamide ribotide isomerase